MNAKKIIIANWKMNPVSSKEAIKIFNETKKTAGKLSNIKTIICPPFVYLPLLKADGAQNVFYEDRGSFTGEISAEMLKDFGVRYVIIGHSERRNPPIGEGETDEIINKKIKASLKAGLNVIFCVGEKERDSEGRYLGFLKSQIDEGLKNVSKNYFNRLILAYEPIWAIGTGGEADNPEGTARVAIFIRRALLPLLGNENGKKIPVLYGGSVTAKNADDFLKNGGVDGLLVGRASLDPKIFNEILKIANE
jgi:triosephosphate isomerase